MNVAPAPLPTIAVQPEITGRSLWSDARRRFLRNRAAIFGSIVLLIMAIGCFGAPYFGLRSPAEINWDRISAPPFWWPVPSEKAPGPAAAPQAEAPQVQDTDAAGGYDISQFQQQQQEQEQAQPAATAPADTGRYWFGTDENGRDLFVRTLYGGQVSITVGLVATFVSLVIGIMWGAAAGFAGGWLDGFMMRIVDILYSLPFIFFVIMLTVVFGRHIVLIYVAIGAVSWLDMARIVRGQTLSLKRKEFIEAARAAGVSNWGIIRKHIIPNSLGPVIVYVMLTVPAVILTESFISYLGMGVQEPQSSWGTLIADGVHAMQVAPWQLLFPSLFLAITLVCLNFLGDGLRDALDPKDR
ncbi:MAG TPA: ABC transporter permease subunit [Dongiaceae bacterium]|jgi:oligopeptide transport system permease protein|nr:ABC transporter permease subunit [Dongiaceae bacterium]